MTSLRASSTHEPLSSLSEPPSPIEEDLAKASAWDDEATSTLVAPKWKGKGKQVDDAGDDDDDGQREAEAGQYPPMAGEDLEARKIEENLKRWETLEKQRRKNARDSSTSSSSSSLLGDATRRAGQLWNKSSADRRDSVVRPHARTSGHAVLEDVDEALPMEEPPETPTPTPRASTTENPFESPEEREAQSGTLMTAAGPGSLPPTPRGKGEPSRPILEAQTSSYSKHPPPQPLGLPDPEEQARRRQQVEMEEEVAKDKRWWTEWLCGCREHGDHQAGRTNPME